MSDASKVPPQAPVHLSDADYQKLTPAAKLDYARQFDQKQFQRTSPRS
jgi:hypothetical protein